MLLNMRSFSVVIQVVFLSLFISAVAWSGAELSDPVIPNNEIITYSLTLGGVQSTLVETVVCGDAGGVPVYTITSSCAAEDKNIVLSKKNMVAISYKHVWRSNGTIISRTHSLRKQGRAYTQAVAALHHHCLQYMYRGFPFKKVDRIDLVVQGGDTPIKLFVVFEHEEQVQTGMGAVACYKLKAGMQGLLGKLVPKSYYWYSKAAPHYLVKYEGASGPPGSPQKAILLKSYSAGF